MDKQRKIILAFLISTLMIVSGTLYYISYVNSHSSVYIDAKVYATTSYPASGRLLTVHINAEINSTNKFTKFYAHEYPNKEGIDIYYAGTNRSYATNLISGNANATDITPSIVGFINFNISYKHPMVSVNWNFKVFNYSSLSYQEAPKGYYYLVANVVSDGFGFIFVKVSNQIIHVANSSVTVNSL